MPRSGPAFDVALLPVPHPYRAMLAICSDLDETPGLDCYLDTSRYLNTEEETRYGRGVGLEVGNTIYFDMPDGEFSYWNTTDAGRQAIRKLIRSGHVDCVHSFGDTAVQRDQARRCIEELEAHDCRMQVWIDHAVAPSNFGADIMQGRGDLPGSDVYHADLSLGYGIRYLSRGRVTSMIGQDAPVSFRGIATRRYLPRSAKTLAKEMIKFVLARAGSAKYAMHASNKLLRTVRLRDGREAREFLRCNPHPAGLEYGENAAGLGEVITEDFLDRLALRQGKCVLYTHLGKKIDAARGFPDQTVAALQRLRRRYAAGEILVTTTARLLRYAEMLDSMEWRTTRKDDGTLEIDVAIASGGHYDNNDNNDGGQGPAALDGLGFRVGGADRVRMTCNGVPQVVVQDRIDGQPAHAVACVPWRRLVYPA